MNPDVQQLLETDPRGVWVALDVLMEALEVGHKRAYQLIRTENIRTAGRHPRQYNLNDIARVWRNRQPERHTK